MKSKEQAASDCGDEMCDKYGMTIDHSIPCEDAFKRGYEFGRGVATDYAKFCLKSDHDGMTIMSFDEFIKYIERK